MKKVCILSMQQIDNYGSVLQAYCIKKIIESMNCTVSFIDIKKIEEDTNRDYYLTSDEALDYGLIDKVLIKNKE